MSWVKKKNQMLLFKVDFKNAYDYVNWDHLIFMLSSLGFGFKWCTWNIGCIDSAKTSVLVNGSPTCEFCIKRGLRQRDPFRPFLFIIVMEGLHLATMDINFIRGIKAYLDYFGSVLFGFSGGGGFLSNPDEYWVSIIKSIHGNVFEKVSSIGSSTCSNIVMTCSKSITGGLLSPNVFRMKIRNGRNIHFWHDLWCGNSSLSSRYNWLFHLDVNKGDMVADKRVNGDWFWTWSRETLGSRNEQLISSLCDDLRQLIFSV
ncbi:uncharacterized protein [Rutidosis leptorrhynchoides]|uniref:uncharacterized protein n=1 Tax=Rutidosis leptorrhynchoides TaxID=125765 RepID=UPI003A997BA9